MTAVTPPCDKLHGPSFSRVLLHVDHGKSLAVHQWNRNRSYGNVTFCGKELRTGKRRSHLIAPEARGPRGVFASLQNQAAYAAARPCRMDEERANLRGVHLRVELGIFPARPPITAIERFAFAPSAATHDGRLPLRPGARGALRFIGFRFSHNISAIGDQLAIQPKHGLQCALDLRRRVVLGLQSAHGRFNELAQHGDVFGSSKPQTNPEISRHRETAHKPSEWRILSRAKAEGGCLHSRCALK